MYYHCCVLKNVKYGIIKPPPLNIYEDFDIAMYKWVAHYCGYFPQVWLSKNDISITGFRNQFNKENDGILFCFKDIKGFPVSYRPWEYLMNTLINVKTDNIAKINKKINEDFMQMEKWCIEDGEKIDGELKGWVKSDKNIDLFLRDYVFVEKDQVVVPSLDLRLADKIICRDIEQKRALRKMGFKNIECKKVRTTKY